MPRWVFVATDKTGNALLTPYITEVGRPGAPWQGCRAYGGRRPGETTEAFHARQPELQRELISHIGQAIWDNFIASALNVKPGEAFGINIGRCVLFAFDLDSPPADLGVVPSDNAAVAVTKVSRWALALPAPAILQEAGAMDN
jgi:hypothetical protein